MKLLKNKAQHGITLLEVILGITIMASVTVGLNSIASQYESDTKNTVTASHLRAFGDATKAYVKTNFAAVKAVAEANDVALIDVEMLKTQGFLQSGYQNTNPYGQTVCALADWDTDKKRLHVLIAAEDGGTIGDPSLASIVAQVGGSGGGIYGTDIANKKNTGETDIVGAFSGWKIEKNLFNDKTNHKGIKCDGTSGKVQITQGHPLMAIWFDNGEVESKYLNKATIPGVTGLTTMTSPLVINSTKKVDDDCGDEFAKAGALAPTAGGALLKCDIKVNKWKFVGLDDQNTLTAGTVSMDGETISGGSVWTGGAVTAGSVTTDGTVTAGKVSKDGKTISGGSVWTGGAVTAGSISTVGTVTSGTVSTDSATNKKTISGGRVWTGGDVTAETFLTVNKTKITSGIDVVSNNVRLGQQCLDKNGELHLNSKETWGTLAVICFNGNWHDLNPAGTWCGARQNTGDAGESDNVKLISCQGYDPLHQCPNGYERRKVFAAGKTGNELYTCVKDWFGNTGVEHAGPWVKPEGFEQ